VTTFTSAGHTIRFDGGTTHVMAVVNLSPESKNRDTFAADADEAAAMAERHRRAGATIIDLGAQSSVRGNEELDPTEELGRLLEPLRRLVAEGHVVSVDTWKPAVAAAAVDCGAAIVNDTGGLGDPAMVEVVARSGVAAVAMYLEGTSPIAVSDYAHSDDKAFEMAETLGARLAALAAAGVTQTIVDPGIGITYGTDYAAYTRLQLAVVRDLGRLKALGHPVLVPVPRKVEPARVAAFMTLALEHGADVIRVHDVEAACDLVRLFDRAVA